MMRWQDGLRLTTSTLTSRPLRSLLTLLGVAIGIAAVALLTAMGEGLRLYVLDNFSQFGTRIIAIHPGKTQTGGLGGILSSVRPLTLTDAEALRRLPHIEAVVPLIQGSGDIQFGVRSRRSDIIGGGHQLAEAWRFRVALGQFLPAARDGRSPPPMETGFKDTVVVNPREQVRVLLRFEENTDPDLPYMYHCHILEHEDAGMMGQFTVVRN